MNLGEKIYFIWGVVGTMVVPVALIHSMTGYSNLQFLIVFLLGVAVSWFGYTILIVLPNEIRKNTNVAEGELK